MPRSTRRFMLAATLAAILMPPNAWAQDVVIQTARGEVTLPATPERVAVLDIAALDTLEALGVPIAGVPDRLYLDHLSHLRDKAEVVGTLFEPDLEKLAVLDPDLIIVGGRSSTQLDNLSPLAPVIDMTIWFDPLEEAQARLTAYGTLFGKADKAAELTATLTSRIDAVRGAAAGKGRALILMTNGPKVSAYGRGTRFGWIHDALGIPEAHENLDPQVHGNAVSFEFIADVNPDWLIVVDRSAALGQSPSAAATLNNPLVAGTTAAQLGQILQLSSAPIYIASGGYSSILITLDELLTEFGG